MTLAALVYGMQVSNPALCQHFKMKRHRLKKHHWTWIACLVFLTAILAAPLDIFIAFILDTKQKVEITTELIESMTMATKTVAALIFAILAIWTYNKRK